jgi:hypothetical protein
MKTIKFLQLAACLFLSASFVCQNASAAINLTITPSAVSNTYNGKITLQVTGISSGSTVVIQKFLDANTNNIIDASDYLVQQYSLTDGQASVFHDGATAVTNVNVPGDTDGAANGSITAVFNFQNGDFSQNFVGKYLYKVSSSSGNFTNTFTITNFPFGQSFTGTIFSNNTATVVSNAVVLLFQPSGGGNLNPVGGGVANNSGVYSIAAPPGTYLLAAVRSNYMANISTAPVLTLGSTTISTNLTLTNATQSISGRIVDSVNSSIGLPGLLMPLESTTNDFLAVSYTDTNGNFKVGTRPDLWRVQNDDGSLIVHGYVSLQNSVKTNTAGGSVSGITNSLPKGTAIFYGRVTDIFGNPMANIDIGTYDSNSLYESDGYTDTNGYYVTVALAGLGGDLWWVGYNGNPTDYVFSQPAFDQNGGTNFSVGQAIMANFTGILATNFISGNVQFNGTNLMNLGVNATATISNVFFQVHTDTDTNGNYSFNVPNATWDVSLNCGTGNDSLGNILGGASYSCPNDQFPVISGNNSTNNFVVPSCNSVQITTPGLLPAGQAGSSYDQFLQASSCNPSFTWSVVDPQDLPPNLVLETTGELHGPLTTAGTNTFTVQVVDGSSNTTNQLFTLVVNSNPNPPPSVSISSATGGQVIVYYPESGSNYVLQTTTNLVTGPWVPATNGVQVIALTFSNSSHTAFFRLQ